mmetsp:Transcript_27024/g.43402  ORF Transcript_27024/g.43402 Transcript_27024/m.43402 type:complete len:84 (-) Transcript_27024:581-832(-)
MLVASLLGRRKEGHRHKTLQQRNNENLDRLIRKQSSVTNPPDQAVRASVIEHLNSDLHGCISLELIKFIIHSPSASAVPLEHY